MTPKSLIRMVCISVAAVSALLAVAAPSLGRAASGKPKTIILGFDGVDAELAKQWMDEGALPNMKRLAERGAFSPLGSANPAQSPVSWAVMETGSNPGKTNVPDFVRRVYNSNGEPMPTLAGVHKEMIDADKVGDYVPLKRGEKVLMWLAAASHRGAATGGVAFLLLLIFFAIFRFVLRVPAKLAALAAALVGGAGGYVVSNALKDIPERFPVPIAEMQGDRFWEVLAKNGVRFTGLQVPAAFPASRAFEGARLLAGLFTPDVQGGPGAWAIYTNDEWAPSRPSSTETGGTENKIWEDKDGVYRTTILGPENFVKKDRFDRAEETLRKMLGEPGIAEEKRGELTDQLLKVVGDRERWKLDEGEKTKIDFWIEPDFENRTAKITIDGETQTIAEGKWSDYFEVKYKLTRFVQIDAIPHIYLSECRRDADDNKRLRIFLPPVSISPKVQPPVLPISYPREFIAELAEEIKNFDTIGWACWTNALKDEMIDEKPFLEGLSNTLEWRTKQLEHELAKDDWEVLFHVESTTDRAGHMLFRFIDEKHPQYGLKLKSGALLRDQEFEAFGRKFPLKDGIKETYKEMDRIVGSVVERIDAGKFGPDATLMVISDHGFDSFRYGVNLNNLLWELGYLVRKDGVVPAVGTVAQIVTGATGDMLSYIDWTKTRAYSLGLGKIFLSIEGDGKIGIVPKKDVAALKAELIAKLEAYMDPRPGFEGIKPILHVYDADVIYSGPYKREPGDLIIGFDSGYRVSWQTSLGGFEEQTVAVNPEPWTGDHCGVDPSLVKGIFFSNKKLPAGFEPNLLNIAPTVLAKYGVPLPAEWDGKPMDLK